MIDTAVVGARAFLGAVSPAVASWKNDELNQLETARLVQPAQRVDFGVEGDNSFKFSFADPVCCLHSIYILTQ